MTITAPPHPTWFADARRIIDITEVTPGLPIPTISPARATYDYRYLTHAVAAREAVASAQFTLHRELGAVFTPRLELAGDRTPRYLLEALLPSGLTLVIISRAEHVADQDDHEDAPELAAAAA